MTSGPPTQSDRTYGIAQLSREFGLTRRALRYYEEVGLLSPQRRAGARYYSSRDRARIVLILGSRAMGMPLASIGRLFELCEREEDVEQMAQAVSVFQQQIRLLENKRDEVGQAITMLQAQTERLSRAGADRSPSQDSVSPVVRRAGRHAAA